MNIWDLVTGGKRPFTITSNFDDGKVILVADACESFTLEQGLEITEHPIENGANISDHAQVKLKRVAVRFIITEAPLTVYSGLSSIGLGIIGSQIGGTAGAITQGVGAKITDNLLGSGQSNITNNKTKIDQLVYNKQVVSLTVKNHSVANFMLESVSYPDSVDIGNSLLVEAVFKEIKTTESITTEAKVSGLKKSAVGAVSKGIKQTLPAFEEVYEQARKDKFLSIPKGM